MATKKTFLDSLIPPQLKGAAQSVADTAGGLYRGAQYLLQSPFEKNRQESVKRSDEEQVRKNLATAQRLIDEGKKDAARVILEHTTQQVKYGQYNARKQAQEKQQILKDTASSAAKTGLTALGAMSATPQGLLIGAAAAGAGALGMTGGNMVNKLLEGNRAKAMNASDQEQVDMNKRAIATLVAQGKTEAAKLLLKQNERLTGSKQTIPSIGPEDVVNPFEAAGAGLGGSLRAFGLSKILGPFTDKITGLGGDITKRILTGAANVGQNEIQGLLEGQTPTNYDRALAAIQGAAAPPGEAPQKPAEDLAGRQKAYWGTSPYDTPEIIAAREKARNTPYTSTINTPEREALRQQAADTVYGTGATKKERKAFIVTGPPAAGKTGHYVTPLKEHNGALVIDNDEVKPLLGPEWDNGRGAGIVHPESSDIADYRVLKRAVRNGENVVLPIIGKSENKVRSLIRDLRGEGYDIYLYNVQLPPDKAAQRAADRFAETGRFVDPAYVLSIGTDPEKVYTKVRSEEGVVYYEQATNDVPKGTKPVVKEHSKGPRGLPDGQYAPGVQGTQTGTQGKTQVDTLLHQTQVPEGNVSQLLNRAPAIPEAVPRGPSIDLTPESAKPVETMLKGKSATVAPALREVMSRATSPEEAVAAITKFTDQYVQGADPRQLADFRAAVNKEIGTLVGGTGNYKKDYAMRIALREDPEVGPMIQEFETSLQKIEDARVSLRQAKTAQKAEATSPPNAPEGPPKSGDGTTAGPEKLAAGGGEYILYNLDTTKDVEELIRQVAKANDELIKTGRRGTISFEETRRAADMLGIDLSKVGPGKALNAEELTAAGDILKTVSEKANRLREDLKAAPLEERPRKKLAYLEAQHEMSLVMAKVLGAESESARALNSIKMLRKALADPSIENTRKIYKEFGGEKNVDGIIDRYNDLVTEHGQEAGYEFLRSMQKKNFFDYLEWYWYNAILSGTRTHIRNTVGNIVSMVSMPVESVATGVLEGPVAALEGRKRAAYAGEGMAELYGIKQGLTDGMQKAIYLLRKGYSLDAATKLELGKLRGPGGLPGATIGLPGRLLSAADQLARTVVYNMKLSGLAYREAKNAGKTGAKFSDTVADFYKNPTPRMVDEAVATSKNRTYQDEMGAFGHALKNLQRSVDIKGFHPITFVVPFVQTPVNVAKFAAERGAVTGPIIGAFQAATRTGVPRSEALGRAALASMTGTIIGLLAAEGKISGPGPSNEKDRDLLLEQGWKPYAFKIGNTWVSYQNVEPLSSVLLQPALLWEMFKYDHKAPGTQEVSRFFAELARSYTNQSFLRGVADWLDAVTAPEDKAKQYLQRFAGSFIPNIVSTTAGALDPVARNPKGILQEFQSRLPGQTGNVPPRLDAFKTPIVYERAPGAAGILEAFTPLNRSTEQPGAGQLREDANTAARVREIDTKIKSGEPLDGYPPDLVTHIKAENVIKYIEDGNTKELERQVKNGTITKETVKKALELQQYFDQNLTKGDVRMLLYPPGLKRAQLFLDRYNAFKSQSSQNDYVTKINEAGVLDKTTLGFVQQILGERNKRKNKAGETYSQWNTTN